MGVGDKIVGIQDGKFLIDPI